MRLAKLSLWRMASRTRETVRLFSIGAIGRGSHLPVATGRIVAEAIADAERFSTMIREGFSSAANRERRAG